MIRTLYRCSIIGCIWLFSCVVADLRCAYGEEVTLKDLQWLVGEWRQKKESGTTVETWVDEGKGVFRGEGAFISLDGKQRRSTESLLLVKMSSTIFYIAKPKENKLPVPFRLTEHSSKIAVFENRNYDFPKRLRYELTSEDSLEVTVSDLEQREFKLSFTKHEASKN